MNLYWRHFYRLTGSGGHPSSPAARAAEFAAVGGCLEARVVVWSRWGRTGAAPSPGQDPQRAPGSPLSRAAGVLSLPGQSPGLLKGDL